MELLRSPNASLTSEDAGQSLASAVLDTEEVRGSDPLAPITNAQVRRRFRVCREARCRPTRSAGAFSTCTAKVWILRLPLKPMSFAARLA
jgi:hypothetical protein